MGDLIKYVPMLISHIKKSENHLKAFNFEFDELREFKYKGHKV